MLRAVDSGSQTEETFRGNVRNAFQGLSFALIQATGRGAITVTASATGLAGSSVTVQASAGTFVPCSGTCGGPRTEMHCPNVSTLEEL